jgi:hypothetical protein
MKYEAFQDKTGLPEWRVEAFEGEDCFITIFCGPLAKERAVEYANFKNQK